MSLVVGAAQHTVLSAGWSEGRGPVGDATDRRAVHGDAVLRGRADDGGVAAARVSDRSQPGASLAAADGPGGALSEASSERAGRSGASRVPVFVAGSANRSSQPGVVVGHHVHPPAAGFCVPGGDPGLVQPLRAVVVSLDNIFTERLWRSVKYEDVYLKDYGPVDEARAGLGAYFHLYNTTRPHQALDYRTPGEVHVEADGDESNNVTGINKKEKEAKRKKMLLLQNSTLKNYKSGLDNREYLNRLFNGPTRWIGLAPLCRRCICCVTRMIYENQNSR